MHASSPLWQDFKEGIAAEKADAQAFDAELLADPVLGPIRKAQKAGTAPKTVGQSKAKALPEKLGVGQLRSLLPVSPGSFPYHELGGDRLRVFTRLAVASGLP